MVYPRPRPGTDAESLLLNSAFFGDLVDLLNAYKAGSLNPPVLPLDDFGRLTLENTTGVDILAGEVQQIKPIAALPTGSGDELVHWTWHENPNMELLVPTWHTAIDNLVAIQTDIADGETYEHSPRHFGTVLATVVETTDRYVMLDPANPRRMRTAPSGIWKIIQQDGNGRCLVDFRESQPLWRYKLTQSSQAPATTTAKLIRLDDGDDFSATEFDLSDPLSLTDRQGVDGEGYCHLVGNEFHAGEGPC